MTTPTKDQRAEAARLLDYLHPKGRELAVWIESGETSLFSSERGPEHIAVAQALADRDARIGELITEALESAAALTVAKSQLADAEERGRQTERAETQVWKDNSTSWAKACTEWSEWADTECRRLGIVPAADASFGSKAQRLGLRLALHQLPLSVWDAALKRLLELANDDRAALDAK